MRGRGCDDRWMLSSACHDSASLPKEKGWEFFPSLLFRIQLPSPDLGASANGR
jgi:hypothetical protein